MVPHHPGMRTIKEVWVFEDALESGPVGWIIWEGEGPPRRIRGVVRGRAGVSRSGSDYELTDIWPPEGDGLVYRRADGPRGEAAEALYARFDHHGNERERPDLD